jgi:hypothetical protein
VQDGDLALHLGVVDADEAIHARPRERAVARPARALGGQRRLVAARAGAPARGRGARYGAVGELRVVHLLALAVGELHRAADAHGAVDGRVLVVGDGNLGDQLRRLGVRNRHEPAEDRHDHCCEPEHGHLQRPLVKVPLQGSCGILAGRLVGVYGPRAR